MSSLLIVLGFVEVDGSSNAITDNCSKFILFTSIISDNLWGIFNSFLSSKIHCKKLSNDNCIGIFIDGTRQKNGRVNKPKQGAALLAFKNQKLLLPVAIVNSHRLIRFKFFIPMFSKIVIKVGKPVQPPQSSSRDDLNSVTMQLQDKINNLIGWIFS